MCEYFFAKIFVGDEDDDEPAQKIYEVNGTDLCEVDYPFGEIFHLVITLQNSFNFDQTKYHKTIPTQDWVLFDELIDEEDPLFHEINQIIPIDQHYYIYLKYIHF